MPTLKTSNSPLVMPPRVPPGATYPWDLEFTEGEDPTSYPTLKPHTPKKNTDNCKNVRKNLKQEWKMPSTMDVKMSQRVPGSFISPAGPSTPPTCVIRLALQEPVATSALHAFPTPILLKKHQFHSFTIKKLQ
jgi:hypothetical protein